MKYADPGFRMLYDFHKWQNDKKPGSVYATYLIYGAKKAIETDGDVEMSSSMPEMDSFSEQLPTNTLTLVTEEKLEGAYS